MAINPVKLLPWQILQDSALLILVQLMALGGSQQAVFLIE